MKTRYLFLGALAVAALFFLIAASPPVGVGLQHNRFTTNVNGEAVIGPASFKKNGVQAAITIPFSPPFGTQLGIVSTNAGIGIYDASGAQAVAIMGVDGFCDFGWYGLGYAGEFRTDGAVLLAGGNGSWNAPGSGEGGGSDFFNIGIIQNDGCVLHDVSAGGIIATLGSVQIYTVGRVGIINSAKVGGTIFVNTTQTGNTGAGETAIYSNNIAGVTLVSDGDRLYVEAGGTITASVNNKRIKVYFGATTVFDTGSVAIVAAASWHIQGTITRTGAATQKAIFSFESSSSVLFGDATYSAPGETLAGNVGLLLTSQGGANNDVVSQVWLGEWKSAP